MSDWTPPPVTPEQLRAAGVTSVAMNFPCSEMGARWIAAFNGISFTRIEEQARLGMESA